MSKAQDYFARRNKEDKVWDGMDGKPSENGKGKSDDIEANDTYSPEADGPQDTTDN